jgi:hypothetical protein
VLAIAMAIVHRNVSPALGCMLVISVPLVKVGHTAYSRARKHTRSMDGDTIGREHFQAPV